MGLRTNVPDDEQLFTALHYKPAEITLIVDLEKDTPTPFMYTDYQSIGNKQEDKIILNNRLDAADSRTIETDYTLIEKGDIIIVEGGEYNVSSATPKKNNTGDLRALRGFSNNTYIIVLDA